MSKHRKAPMPVFYPFADISTALITEDDYLLLNDERPDDENAVVNSVFIAKYNEGVFIHMTDEEDARRQDVEYLQQRGYSDQFLKLYAALAAWGFSYARLDGDGLHTDPLVPPSTKKELKLVAEIKNLVDWSRGYHKKPDPNRADFIAAAGYLKKIRENDHTDAEWSEIDQLIARADALRDNGAEKA